MNIIIFVLVFSIVLFIYIHIYYHFKTNNDLEILEINNISNPTSLEEKNEQENEIQKDEIQENKLSKNDYNQLKNLNVSVLRSLAEERNLIKQGEKKKTKKELLNLLAE